MADSPIARLATNPYPQPSLSTRLLSALFDQFDAWKGSLNTCTQAAANAATSASDAGTAIAGVSTIASQLISGAGTWNLAGELAAAHAVATSDPATWVSPLNGWSITTPGAAFTGDWIKAAMHQKFNTELSELYQLILSWNTIPVADDTVAVGDLYNPEVGVQIGT